MKVNFFGIQAEVAHMSKMMICDNCKGVLTNHQQDDNGDWVCQVCGYNATLALQADEHIAKALGQFVGLLAVARKDGQFGKWATMLVDMVSLECGDDALQDLVNIIGNGKL